MDTFLTVTSILICVVGALVSFTAKFIVKKMKLTQRQVIKGIDDQKNLESLKEQKAIMKVNL
jgi:hypothetical protein